MASVDAVTTKTDPGSSAISFSWSHTIAAGCSRIDIVVAGSPAGMSGGTYGVTAVTVGGVAATRITTDPLASGVVAAERWRLLNPPAGAVTIVATRAAQGYAPLGCTAISFIGTSTFIPEEDPGRSLAASGSASPFNVAWSLPAAAGDMTVSVMVVPAAYTAAATGAGAQTERANLVEPGNNVHIIVGTRAGAAPSVGHSYDLTANAAGRDYLTLAWTMRSSGSVAWLGRRWHGPRWFGQRWFGGTQNSTLIVTGLEGSGEVGTPTEVRTLFPAGQEGTGEIGTPSLPTGGSWNGRTWFGKSWFGARWFGPPANSGYILNIPITGVEATGELTNPADDRTLVVPGLEASGEADATTRGIDLDIVPDGPEATGEIGTPTGVWAITPAGQEGLGELGIPVVNNIGQDLYPDGVEAQGELGQPTLVKTLNITGVEATGEVTGPTWDRTLVPPGLEATGELGLPQTVIGITVNLTPDGVEASGELTNPADDRLLAILGLEASGELGVPDIGKAFTPPGVEATGESGIPGVDVGGTVTRNISGEEAAGEIGVPTVVITLSPDGEEALGELHSFFTQIYGAVTLTDVAMHVSTIADVRLGASYLTEVQIR